MLKTLLKSFLKKSVKALIRGPSSIFNYLWNISIMWLWGVKHGPHWKIRGRLHLHGRRHGIEIGDYFMCNSGLRYNPTSGGGETHITVGPKGKLIIGSHVGISNLCLTANNLVRIGNYTMIGSNCMITDTDFHAIDPIVRKKEMDEWWPSGSTDSSVLSALSAPPAPSTSSVAVSQSSQKHTDTDCEGQNCCGHSDGEAGEKKEGDEAAIFDLTNFQPNMVFLRCGCCTQRGCGKWQCTPQSHHPIPTGNTGYFSQFIRRSSAFIRGGRGRRDRWQRREAAA